MKKFKLKVRDGLYFVVKNNFISVFIAAVVVVIFLQASPGQGDWFDITFFSSLVCAMVLEIVAQLLSNILLNSLEDSVKLTTNYDFLVGKYKKKFFTYENGKTDSENLKKMEKKEYTFPIEYVCSLKGCKIKIDDKPDKKYELPELVSERFDEIFAAHKTSTIYNQLNVRADSWELEGDVFTMHTSRTTYFDSMVTNRAMDFKWNNGMSVREVFAYGPIFPELQDSKLSNHLGFNGFVESSDGYIAFIKRGKNLSIAKGTYADSVGASLKTKYALNTEWKFDEEGLRNSMLKEIDDELKVRESELEAFALDTNLIAAYRDVVEGGKPQLLFYARAKVDRETIEKHFEERRKKKKTDKYLKVLEDGSKFLWIKREELETLGITPEMMVYQGKMYKMVPSASAPIAMLIQYLNLSE